MSDRMKNSLKEQLRALVRRSATDEGIRRRLIQDPKSTVQRETGLRFPENVNIQVVEETPWTIYLVVPSASSTSKTDELSDRELDAVAGGWDGGEGRATLPLCTVGEGCWTEL